MNDILYAKYLAKLLLKYADFNAVFKKQVGIAVGLRMVAKKVSIGFFFFLTNRCFGSIAN